MGRIRTIKPEFPQSESMGNVSRDARLTFIQLWTLADDEGRLRGNSRMLASLLFPYDTDAAGLIDEWLTQLEQEGCILRYKNGKDSYMQLCNWLIHQKIDKPSKSKIAPFDESSRILANPPHRIKDQGSKDQGPEDQGSKEGTEDQGSGNPIVERRGASPDLDVVPGIFEYWQKTMNSHGSKLDAKRIAKIRAAIKLGYTPRQLCEAIKGCSLTPHNMGVNDRNTKFNGVELIFRDADHIDRFIACAKSPPKVGGKESIGEQNARIMREVLGEDAPADDGGTIDMEENDE